MNNLCDHYWAESAYLSEWWAVWNLQRVAPEWQLGDELESQLEDEVRHVRMFKDAMAAEGYTPRFMWKNSKGYPIDAMQEVIYRKVCGLDLHRLTMHNIDMFRQVHEITERRAIWIYKTYIKGGNVERYKDVCREIIEDERGHIHPRPKSDNPVLNNLFKMDKWVFLKFLPKHYNGMQLLQCLDFWNDYYCNGLKTEVV